MNMQAFFAALPSRHWRELGRKFRNHQWERNDDGDLLISHAKISGVWESEAPDGMGRVVSHNLITTEGANAMLSVAVGGGTQYATWYIAPFSGNVSVTDAWTAANFAATATELTTQYSEGTRVAFSESVPASKSTNNTANPAVMTAATTNVNVWGLGLLSSSTKGATSGILLSAAKYPTVRTLPAIGDTLGLKYTLSLSNV